MRLGVVGTVAPRRAAAAAAARGVVGRLRVVTVSVHASVGDYRQSGDSHRALSVTGDDHFRGGAHSCNIQLVSCRVTSLKAIYDVGLCVAITDTSRRPANSTSLAHCWLFFLFIHLFGVFSPSLYGEQNQKIHKILDATFWQTAWTNNSLTT